MKKNFKCWLSNQGKWRLEDKMTFGKWIFNIEPIGDAKAPTFGDQRNFFTGLFEAEWRNDNYVFENGNTRPSQHNTKIMMFKGILEEISERERSKVIKGIDFYINKDKNNGKS